MNREELTKSLLVELERQHQWLCVSPRATSNADRRCEDLSVQKYSPEQIDVIRALAEQGYSASQIGAQLGYSRSAVSGVDCRNAIKLHPTLKTKPEPVPVVELVEVVEPVDPPIPETTEFAVHFNDTLPRHCRTPLWPRRMKTGFVCGKPVMEGRSHCVECRRKLYLAPVVKTKSAYNDRRH